MLVKDYMTAEVFTVHEDQTLIEAESILSKRGVISLPVVDDLKRIRGIITSKDMDKAFPGSSSTLSKYEANYLLARLKVKDIMIRNVVTVNQDETIEMVAFRLYKMKFNAFPVVDENNRLCGIISANDIFRAFVESMGMNRDCTRITIILEDKVGAAFELTKLFKENNVNIISFLGRPQNDGTNETIVRADLGDNGLAIIEQLREAGFKVVDVMTLKGLE